MDKYIDENPVALLAEGVDRNVVFLDLKSLSQLVALLAEGVDRNLGFFVSLVFVNRRPPRGGRG